MYYASPLSSAPPPDIPIIEPSTPGTGLSRTDHLGTAPPDASPTARNGAWHMSITATCFDLTRHRRPQTTWNSVNPLQENPYHVALPCNGRAPGYENVGPCKNRWVEVIGVESGLRAFGQWEDAGPWVVNDVAYVFDQTGTVRPFAELNQGKRRTIFQEKRSTRRRRVRRIKNSAGIDLSPSVIRALGIEGKGLVHWRFVDSRNVPDGPWKERISTRPAPQDVVR